MGDWTGILLLYLLGGALLIIELFLPAHGLIGVIGLCILGFGLYEAFMRSQAAGMVSLVALMILLPVGLVISVKNWHRTPVGRRISPPNPELTELDRMPLSDLQALVGKTGRAVTLLRPVGTCQFGDRRVECKAEQSMIAKDSEVEAVGLADRTVVVRTSPRNAAASPTPGPSPVA